MFFKLALNNVKKSIKDYTIYFLTLTFGICIFYVFNSIESQQAMILLNESQKEIIKVMGQVISYVSVFISVILGFLILFANKFLIKRRKKELGLYMTLGMEKGKISRVLILETVIIGVVSLVVGLIAGIFISQGLSVVTAKLFEADMKAFTFIFSQSACVKSIIYFGLIYLIVMVFNAIAISKYKLIDLLTAGKKNESFKIKKLWVSVVLFIISVICLAFAYHCIIKNGMMKMDIVFGMSILFGTIGTLLFFMSLSGFLLKIAQTNKRLYYKNLNMFVLRQLNSKINTTFISMTVICLMLLITIGTLSSGMGLNTAMTKDLESITPFDVTIENFSYNQKEHTREQGIKTDSLAKLLMNNGIDFKKYVKNYVEYKQYKTPLTYKAILPEKLDGIPEDVKDAISKEPVVIVKLSDYNNILKLQGVEPIVLKDNQFAINCNQSTAKDFIQKFLDEKGTIDFNGEKMTVYNKKLRTYSLNTTAMASDSGTVILNDNLVKGYESVYSAINFNLNDSNKHKEFSNEIEKLHKNDKQFSDLRWFTKAQVYEQSIGISAVLTYLTLYIGIVFLITAAAVLALQQLSEASDNAQRYALIRKLGAEPKMINKALFAQILIYFMMPLSLAIVHSIVGIKVANKLVKLFGNLDILGNTIFTAVLFVIIYGGYFLATYFSSKNIIRPRKS